MKTKNKITALPLAICRAMYLFSEAVKSQLNHEYNVYKKFEAGITYEVGTIYKHKGMQSWSCRVKIYPARWPKGTSIDWVFISYNKPVWQPHDSLGWLNAVINNEPITLWIKYGSGNYDADGKREMQPKVTIHPFPTIPTK